MKKLLRFCVLGALLLSVLPSCVGVTHVDSSGTRSVTKGSSLAVVNLRSEEPEEEAQLTGILSAELLRRGFSVRTVEPDEVVPPPLLEVLRGDGDYSFLKVVSEQALNKILIEGKADVLDKHLEATDMSDARHRFSDLLKLFAQFTKDWPVDYLLFLLPGEDGDSAVVKVVRVSTCEVVHSLYCLSTQGFFSLLGTWIVNTFVWGYAEMNYAQRQRDFCSLIATEIAAGGKKK